MLLSCEAYSKKSAWNSCMNDEKEVIEEEIKE
jgi:hypothetical protein